MPLHKINTSIDSEISGKNATDPETVNFDSVRHRGAKFGETVKRRALKKAFDRHTFIIKRDCPKT